MTKIMIDADQLAELENAISDARYSLSEKGVPEELRGLGDQVRDAIRDLEVLARTIEDFEPVDGDPEDDIDEVERAFQDMEADAKEPTIVNLAEAIAEEAARQASEIEQLHRILAEARDEGRNARDEGRNARQMYEAATEREAMLAAACKMLHTALWTYAAEEAGIAARSRNDAALHQATQAQAAHEAFLASIAADGEGTDGSL